MSSDIRKKLAARINKKMNARVLNQQLGIETLKRHSDFNSRTGRTLKHPDGSESTVLSGSVEDSRLNGGKPTLIPFLYDGKIVEGADAVERAVKSKKVFPAFDTNEQATVVSKQISAGLGKKK